VTNAELADRRAYLCLSVVLGETRTLPAARAALAGIGPEPVRDRAGELLDRLTDD
jgi:hypothetical protein